MSGLKKMQIVAYKDDKFTSKVSGGSYVVMLNPENITINRSVNYNEEQAPDSGKLSSKYRSTPGQTLSFDLIIDCTGVVDSTRTDMPTEITQLQKVVYDYNGDIHRPNYVTVYWGQGLSFQGVTTTFNTTYKYFRPDGTALRASVKLEFKSYTNAQVAAQEEDKKSPDLTHQIDVIEGDSLPQFSQQIYNDPDLFVQLAAYNKLNKFRQLPAGTQISAPPLKNASGGDQT